MKRFLLVLPFLFACSALQAAPVQISALPSSPIGPGFQHNNFHDSSLAKGTDGLKLGWFTLGAGGGSWDPDTGAFQVNIDIFAGTDQGMVGAVIGTALGTGNLSPAQFNGFDGGLIGSITWNFDAAAQGAGLFDTTMNFHDIAYLGGAQCNPAFEPNKGCPTPGGISISLWGSNGFLDPVTGKYEGVGIAPTLGVDFVATFVPVPAAVWLFGSGLVALVGVSRRKKSHS